MVRTIVYYVHRGTYHIAQAITNGTFKIIVIFDRRKAIYDVKTT